MPTATRRCGAALAACAAALLLAPPAGAEGTHSRSAAALMPADRQLEALLGSERLALESLPPAALAAPGPAKPRRAARRKKDRTPDVVYDPAWLAAQPLPAPTPDWTCLARALYFEARGETLQGQFAVAEVILNRVDSPLYPDSVCAVVEQANRNGCQFSFHCDGRSDAVGDRAAFAQVGRVAGVMLAGAPRSLTAGATHFHTRAVRPGWAHRFPRTAAIGAHLFYRQPGALPAAAAH
jgi:spore germination cell wall hydrolase CwlJ-like protein